MNSCTPSSVLTDTLVPHWLAVSRIVCLVMLECTRGFIYPLYYCAAPCPPIDSIITLMSVWRIAGQIIRTTIMLITYARV